MSQGVYEKEQIIAIALLCAVAGENLFLLGPPGTAKSMVASRLKMISVFKEDVDIVPTIINDSLSYMLWGGDNQMPFGILSLIEKDETLATYQCFNAEVCYGSGLRYNTCVTTAAVKSEVEDFMLDNDLAAYFLSVSQDFKHFGFAISVLILNEDGTKIVRLLRDGTSLCNWRFSSTLRAARLSACSAKPFALRLLPGYHIAVVRVKHRCCRTRLRFFLFPELSSQTNHSPESGK